MKTICFDFDGVFNTYKNGWKGETVIEDPPFDGIEDELKKLKEKYDIVIYSARAATQSGRTAILKWLEKYNLYSYIDVISEYKPRASVYVDDRGFYFDGNWKGLADKISDFVEKKNPTIKEKNREFSNEEKGFLITCIMLAASETFYCFPRHNKKYCSESGVKYGTLTKIQIVDLLRKLGGDDDDFDELFAYL